MRCHPLPMKLFQNQDTMCWRGCGERQTVGRNISWNSHYGKVWRFLSKNEISYTTVNLLLVTKGYKTLI